MKVQNHHWSTNRTRFLWKIEVQHDLFNYLGSYGNIMQFQISSRRENRYRDTRVINIRVLRKDFSKYFCFIRCRSNSSVLLNRGGISDLPLLRRLLSTLPKVLRAKFLGTDGHFCFTSMHVWQLQEPSLSEPYFRFRRFILLLQLEKKISMSKWHSEVWPDTYDEGYIHQFQPELAHKIPYQQWKHLV